MNKMKYVFALVIICFLFTTPVLHAAEDTDWATIDAKGLYSPTDEQHLSKSLWKGYTQARAMQTLDYFPKTLQSPTYKLLMRRLLLSSAQNMDESIEAPLFLAKRIEMLIQYGLFDDAQNLYEAAGDSVRQDFNLAMMGVALTMTRDELPAACLDIKTLSNQFQNMPAWRELSNYCTARFGEKSTLSAPDLNFKKFPFLNNLLAGEVTNIPKTASAIETLIAFSDKRISDQTYNDTARAIALQNDLFIRLALNPKYKDQTTYQCYAIESANRGIYDRDGLSNLYTSKIFDDGMINGENQTVTMHPCDVPAFFYQRLTKTDTPEIEIPILLDSTQSITPHAFAPHAAYIQNNYDINASYAWRATKILALNDLPFEESDANIPLQRIKINESISQDDAISWKNAIESTQMVNAQSYDFTLPIYISRINSGDFNKLDKNIDKFNYENFFSLTYSHKSLHSDIGIYDALSSAIDNDDVPRAFVIMMSELGQYNPSDLHPDAIAVILSSLGEFKLDKEKQALSIEALH